jgi:arsenate reductase-like glutaredoxin family protein
MVEEPTLIRRPLVVSGETIVVGFDRDALESIGPP